MKRKCKTAMGMRLLKWNRPECLSDANADDLAESVLANVCAFRARMRTILPECELFLSANADGIAAHAPDLLRMRSGIA